MHYLTILHTLSRLAMSKIIYDKISLFFFAPLTLNQTSINVPPLSILHEAVLKTSLIQECVV